ncbi:MAG TPA: hypothetical protein VH120_03170 [Gemmataceae bacterium]|nr:hypothetical protein [Gemmataceae bacterium]
MNDPIAYFITWTTYGTWLSGDQRGWIKRGQWVVQPPDPELELRSRQAMTGDFIVLTPEQRAIVDQVVVDHCRIRNWVLHARNVRTNHVHLVLSAPVHPRVIREQLKAWASRRLSDAAALRGHGRDGRRRWWTEKGDIEWIRDEDNLERVIHYVLELQ